MCDLEVPALDCFKLLWEMNEAGVSNAEVARRMGKRRSTVMRWKEGAQPQWKEGQRLLLLHAYVTNGAIRNTECARLPPGAVPGPAEASAIPKP